MDEAPPNRSSGGIEDLPDRIRAVADSGQALHLHLPADDLCEVARLIEAGRKAAAERAALNARRDAINDGWQANQLVLDRARDLLDRGRAMMAFGFFMAVAGLSALLTCLVVPG